VRSVCYSVASSLDGCIAGPHDEFDWIEVDPEIDFGALFRRFDTVLMGRKSYEAARRQGSGVMPGLTAYVFSNTLRQEDCVDAKLANDPGETVRALKNQPGKDIWLFGGGSLFNSLLGMGLVDEVQVAIVPVLLGGGRPLLEAPAERNPLLLRKHTLYPKTGTVLLDYDVVRR
jgi:dihydrofolate reductase